MMDSIYSLREWFQVSQVQFGFLFPEELRRISVCEIDKYEVYDKEKKPYRGGLYDPKLGVSPNDRESVCQTCGHKGLECSGHSGHIQLIVPTYNPLIMDILLRILKISCFHCHRFRIRQRIKDDYIVLLELVRRDRLKEAAQYYSINVEQEKKIIQKLEGQSEVEKGKPHNIQRLEKARHRLEFSLKIKAECKSCASRPSSTSIEMFSQFLKFFLSLNEKKCPQLNCKRESKRVKKEGASKIFFIDREGDQDSEINHIRKKSRDSTSKAGESTAQPIIERQLKKTKQRYVSPKEVYNQLRKIWHNQSQLVKVMFGNQSTANSFTMFFISTVFVPPSRFRPESKLGEEKYLHDHTTILARILTINYHIKKMLASQFTEKDKELDSKKVNSVRELEQLKTQEFKKTQFYGQSLKRLKAKHQFINKCLELQDSINCFIDSTKSSRLADKDFKGVRQILQKKQGLFRMKMMGKRVNFAARSVISPDPSLNTDEVGVPVFMAKKLTFCQHINEYNLEKLQACISNGSKKYPGANFLEQNGRIIRLDLLSDQQRISHARNLWNNYENKIVYRHLQTGDNVLFNRQPTLHKAGLMAHRIKVLPKESTLRMNYANCKSYNADFDGDQMNMHALQTYMAKAEAELCISDQMYESPTNGKPLRELMQDSIISAVYLSMKDCFFEKSDYSELLYQATFSLFTDKPRNYRFFLLNPAIQKPRLMWTGKQLISNVTKIIIEFSDIKYKHCKGLNMKSTTKISKNYLKGYEEQSEVVIMDNELLKGIIDKNQIGSGSDYGFIHSFNQMYGEALTGRLMTCLNKLFLNYMQMHGFTCGLDDLQLKRRANKTRAAQLQEVHEEVVKQICNVYGQPAPKQIYYMGRSNYECDETGNLIEEKRRIHVHKFEEILRHLEYKIVNDKHAIEELDSQYKHHLNQKSSKVIDDALGGFHKQFPHNNFSMMTVTGAKGSNVNHSQVAVMLGQQQLEGKRVPIMITGKTLPSFTAYDPNPRASGFVSDRFLTGLRVQQFYFHCMAGRQGLIDTAVKTSRSGYLQRCLMKHLQSLKVEYDLTVRDSDGSVIQFLYGEDGLNSAKDKFFNKLDLLKNNKDTFKAKLKHQEFRDIIKTKQVNQWKKLNPKIPIQERFLPSNILGSISQKTFHSVNKSSLEFQEIFALKYKKGMVDPGQAVGCTAAQSIGEPSTQMTLNTFHLAGHGGVNLTLGIPRLRQLLMTSSDKIKTPIMELFFNRHLTKPQAISFSKKLQKVKLGALIKKVFVQEWKQLYNKDEKLLDYNNRLRYYKIIMQYQKQEFMKAEYSLTYKDIEQKIKFVLMSQLLNYIGRVKKRNELKAEIKRVHLEKEIEEEDDQIQIEFEKEKEEKQGDKEDKDSNMEGQQDILKQEKELEQPTIKFNSSEFEKIVFAENKCEITIKVSLNLKKFLMTKVIQKLLSTTIMREIQGINSVTLLQTKKGVPYLQTEGVNFDIIHTFQQLNWRSTKSNDIQAISKKFGIEAARNVLISQIVTLFGAYGVSVDYRHLYLIGDYVTFGGVIKAMNRNWMKFNPSPFLRMTFETSVKFITEAALRCEVDFCKTPSSNIIMGQCPKLGTGMHDILMETSF